LKITDCLSLPLTIAVGLALLTLTARADAPFEVKVTGSGPPMILVPGLACSGEVWDETVVYFSKTYECHVVTLAGFAGVPSIGGPFIDTMRDSLIGYIRRWDLKRPVLMGHSLGGLIAMALAVKEPDLAGRLVIVDSYPFAGAIFDSSITADVMRPQADMFRNRIISQSRDDYRKTQPHVLTTMIRDSSRIAQVLQWGLASDPAAVGQATFEALTTDLRTPVANISVPVLVLGSWIATKFYGGSKQKTADHFRSQFRHVPDVTIAVADSARHFIMYDDLPWMLDQMDSFLNRTASKN
jgi:pimeloyl-ACP methyl ester carboxylesterase